MEVAVNTRLLLKDHLEGIGWFTHETMKRITRDHPEHHFYFLFDRNYDADYLFEDNITPLIVSPQARHPILHYLWFEHALPPLLNRIKPDIFVSPDGYLSLKAKCKQLPVMHDLNFEHFPKVMPWHIQRYYQHYFPRFAKKASRIATVSEYSKKDIANTYAIKEDKIDVVYSAAKNDFSPLNDLEIKECRDKYADGKPYFIFVGSLQARKNLKNLLLAFDDFRKKTDSETKLLVVGAKKWWNKEVRAIYENMQYKSEVILLGRVSQEELQKLIPSALALTYASLFEGFGVPILEGFASEIPVITSNTSSMPEVAKDGAILVDPYSINSIAEALIRIEKEPILRKELISKGKKREPDFSWDKTAELLWNSIEKTIKENTN